MLVATLLALIPKLIVRVRFSSPALRAQAQVRTVILNLSLPDFGHAKLVRKFAGAVDRFEGLAQVVGQGRQR